VKNGSIKLRRVRGGVSIRATGDVADSLVVSILAGVTRGKLQRPSLRLHFADDGQDVLRWELDADGRITACEPYQADIFVGGQVHSLVSPGSRPVFSLPRSLERRRCAWTIEAVELLP
jgi:hypothetical protein